MAYVCRKILKEIFLGDPSSNIMNYVKFTGIVSKTTVKKETKSNDAYRGAKNVPKGKHRESIKKCTEKRKIRYYRVFYEMFGKFPAM